MQKDFPKLNPQEQLKAENDFLKMKIMLERGGHFGNSENDDLPPELENQFLNNIIAFEEQFEKQKLVKVFDKIGRPDGFRPVSEIKDDDIGQAWKELSDHLGKHNINVDVCAPNVTTRELYRFVTEELFEYEMTDIDLPGLTTNFIYDEFHPDPVYDNSRLVEQELFRDIFSKDNLLYDLHFADDGFIFNGQGFSDFNSFSEKVNRFKSLFDEISLIDCTINGCKVEEQESFVYGTYKATAITGGNELSYSGSFTIRLLNADSAYWYFKTMDIGGFKLE